MYDQNEDTWKTSALKIVEQQKAAKKMYDCSPDDSQRLNIMNAWQCAAWVIQHKSDSEALPDFKTILSYIDTGVINRPAGCTRERYAARVRSVHLNEGFPIPKENPYGL